jgi:hypothetical protein
LLTDARLLGCTWSCSNGPGQGFLCPAEAAWASCDAQITRLIVGPDSMPLDIGRATRVVPAHMRRALTLRDKGCITPGCTRPAAWCEAHHVKHWADGGDTAVENLALLCEHHHKELHLGMWTITTRSGRPVATPNTNRGGRKR